MREAEDREVLCLFLKVFKSRVENCFRGLHQKTEHVIIKKQRTKFNTKSVFAKEKCTNFSTKLVLVERKRTNLSTKLAFAKMKRTKFST